MLDRVNGELADLLTGGSGGERVLQELEQANAFVVALDARRSWFRYHQLFAELLQLELRGSAPSELPALHAAAAGWYAAHGFALEGVRHAIAAQDWDLAGRLLSDDWLGLGLKGLGATAHELLAAFPAGVIARDPELAARMAGDEMARGSLTEAERFLALAAQALDSVLPGRRARAQLVVTVMRMRFARQRGDLPAVTEHAERLLAPAEAPAEAAEPPPPSAAGPGGPRTRRGPAGGGADRPGHRRGLDRPVRRGGAASRPGRQPGAPDRAALPGGHRPGALGAAGQLAVLPARGAARHAGHRAGRAARLDR